MLSSGLSVPPWRVIQPVVCSFEAERLGRGLEAVRLLVDQVAEALGGFGEALARLRLAQLLFDLCLGRFELRSLRGLDVGELDDVEAELRLHRAGDIAHLHPEYRIVEWLDHLAAREEPQVPAFRGRAGILGVLLRQLGERLRGFLRLRDERLGLLAGLGLLLRRGAGWNRDQDVARAPLFRFFELGPPLLVVLLELLRRDRHLVLNPLERQDRVLHAHLLRELELILVGIVVGLDRVGRDLDLAGELLRRQHLLTHLALLCTQVVQPLHHRGRNESGRGHALARPVQDEVLAQHRLEHPLGHPLIAQRGLIEGRRELAGAPALAESGDLGDDALQFRIGHREPRLERSRVHHALVDQLVEHRPAHFRAVQQGCIDLPAELLAQLLLALAQRLRVLSPADPGAGYRGDLVSAATASKIEVDPEERERDGQQRDDHSNHDAAVLDEIEHGSGLSNSVRQLTRLRAGCSSRPGVPLP